MGMDWIDVAEYVVKSGLLATEYFKLGKHTKAQAVFTQTVRFVSETKNIVSLHARISLHLRHAAFLAFMHPADLTLSQAAFATAEELELECVPLKKGSYAAGTIDRIETLERASLANLALSVMNMRQGKATDTINRLMSSFKLYSRVADVACRLAPEALQVVTEAKAKEDDPFLAPTQGKGADEPSKDSAIVIPSHIAVFGKKHLSGLQWSAATVSHNNGFLLLLTKSRVPC
jgi:separase